MSFNWLVSAFTFLSSCDECRPLLNYWFLSKRRAACHQDWKFDLIRRVNKKEQLWNIIIYLFVLRINAQTNSCFIEFVKSSYFYTINQPNLCLRCNSPFIILKLYWKLFCVGLSWKRTLSNLGFELSTWNCGQIYWVWDRAGTCELRNRDTLAWIYPLIYTENRDPEKWIGTQKV